MDDLTAKVAVVTGAASGIGYATAQALAVAGAKVVLADVDATELESAAARLVADGHDALAIPTDVTSATAVDALRDAALDAFGAVHILHNNAGVVAPGLIDELSLDLWKWVLDVDLWGVIHGVRSFLPLMKEQGVGHIVNTASTAGLQAMPGIGPYNVAKFGVVALSETLRGEVEGTGLGVSVLCPGAVRTRIVDAERNLPSTVNATESATADGFRTRAGAMLAEQGMAPEDVAAMVVDAIRTNRFWIITHDGWHDVMEQRAAGMRSGELVQGFGG